MQFQAEIRVPSPISGNDSIKNFFWANKSRSFLPRSLVRQVHYDIDELRKCLQKFQTIRRKTQFRSRVAAASRGLRLRIFINPSQEKREISSESSGPKVTTANILSRSWVNEHLRLKYQFLKSAFDAGFSQ